MQPLLINSSSETLLREQYRTLTRMIPFLYTVCIAVNLILTMVFSFNRDAPA